MNFILISHQGGFFGEFIATELAKNPGFANDLETIYIPELNRYRTPNYLWPINFFGGGNHYLDGWPITSDDLDILRKHYQNKNVVVHTHWFNPDVSKTNLPCQGIRLMSSEQILSRLAYCMTWIKVEKIETTVWELRRQEINAMIENNHPFKEQLRNLLKPGQYRNWKYRCYLDNIFPDGQLNLYNYIKLKSDLYCNRWTKQLEKNAAWYHWDLSPIFLNNTGYDVIENYLEISLDKEAFKSYHEKNLKLLKEKAGMTIEDLEKSNWIDLIYEYAEAS